MNICDWWNCNREVFCKGWCKMHYHRNRNGTDMDASPQIRTHDEFCKHPGCSELYFAKGWCVLHYHRDKNGTPMDAPIQIQDGSRICKEELCEEKYYTNGFCEKHDPKRKESARAGSQRRRAERLESLFNTEITHLILRDIFGDNCMWCKQLMDFENYRNQNSVHLDHVYPLKPTIIENRGFHEWKNVVLACRTCNLSKGNKIIYIEWKPVIGVPGGKHV